MENTIVFEAAGNFEVPVQIVDKYLDAPALELRLILFLLRNANKSFLASELAGILGTDEKALSEAFDYWVKAGVLYHAGGRYSVQRPKIAATEIMRYSADNIAARIDGDGKIKFLYKITEDALKKPLTTEDASVILSLVDWIGLPAEVAALLIQHCGEERKGMRKILTTGIEWSEKGIDTYEKAEEYLEQLKKKRSVVGKTAQLLGIRDRAITEPEKKVFLKWNEEYAFGEELIVAAYEATVQNTGKYAYAYMDKILQSWHKSGCKTLEDVKNLDPAKKKEKKKPAERKVKLDTKAVEQLSWEILTEGDES